MKLIFLFIVGAGVDFCRSIGEIVKKNLFQASQGVLTPCVNNRIWVCDLKHVPVFESPSPYPGNMVIYYLS